MHFEYLSNFVDYSLHSHIISVKMNSEKPEIYSKQINFSVSEKIHCIVLHIKNELSVQFAVQARNFISE